MLPNLFLVGAMKAGTTAVASYLGAHPDVFAPRIKEPNHFSTELHDMGMAHRNSYTRGFDIAHMIENGSESLPSFAYLADGGVYRSLYRDSGEPRYALDASTTYFSSPYAARRIHAFQPDARIIIVLRHKVERAWSEFVMNQRIGIATSDYRAALEREHRSLAAGLLPLFERYASTSLYELHTRRFIDLFGDANVLVLGADDMRNGSAASRICVFLGLPMIDRPIVRENVALVPRFARVNRILHRSGVKYAVGRRLGAGVKRRLSAVTYRADHSAVAPGFAAMFETYRQKAQAAWVWD